MSDKVVVGRIPLSVDLEKVKDFHRKDPILISGIEKHIKENLSDNIEVFQQIENIIATEEAYFVAVYESELEQVDG